MKEGSNLHATDWCGIVKSNDFIPLLTDLEAPTLIYCQNNYMSVCVNLIIEVVDVDAKKCCPALIFVALLKKQGV